jgi:flagellar protein FlaG
MPTEVTTQVRQNVSPIAGESRTQQSTVIEANKAVARQGSSDDGQSVPPTKDSSQPSNEQLEQVAENLNKHVQSLKRDLHFSVDDDTGETVIRVVDSQSQKTIRTIPSEEFLSIQQQFNQSVGMLLNASV